MKTPAIIALLVVAIFGSARADVTITPTKDGLQIVGASNYLKFTLPYPELNSTDKKKTWANKGVEVKDNTATVKYEGGGEIDVAVDAASGTVTMTGVNLPDIGSWQMKMMVNRSFATGGSWQFGTAAPQPFPETQPEKPHLHQGNDTLFTIRAGDGNGLKFTAPPYGYQEVTDLRTWGTDSYAWMCLSLFSPSNATITYKIEDAGPAPAPTDAASTNAAPAMQ